MPRRASRLLLAASCALTSGSACSVLSSPESYPFGEPAPAPDTVERCGLRVAKGDACFGCGEENCCAALAACAGDAECSGLTECQAACAAEEATEACLQGCWESMHPSPDNAAAAAMMSCLSRECADECGPCGALARALPEACRTCVADTAVACEGMQQCSADDACVLQPMCTFSCTTPPCIDRCAAASEEHLETMASLYDSVNSFCSGPCGLGRQWGCVDAYSWGGADPSAPLHVTGQVTGLLGRPVGAGIEVNACILTDKTCDAPLATATWDDPGHFAIDLSEEIGAEGFVGYLYLTQPDVEEPIVPEILMPGRRVVIDTHAKAIVLTESDIRTIASFGARVEYDPATALIVTAAMDCQLNLSSGMTVSLASPDEEIRPFYVSRGTADPDATETDASGLAGFLNVPLPAGEEVDLVRVRAHRDGVLVAEVPSIIRRGHVTSVLLTPLASN